MHESSAITAGLLAFATVFSFESLNAATPVVCTSPNGLIQARVSVNNTGRLSYEVIFRKATVIETSPLGITVDDTDLGANVRLGRVSRDSRNERYPWRGVKPEAVNQYQEAKISITAGGAVPYFLQVRAFNDGVAFRYLVPGTGERTVSGEQTSFKLPAGSLVWWAPTRRQFDYESRYRASDIAALPAEARLAPPSTIELPGRGFAVLTEGNLQNYAGMHHVSREDRTLQCRFMQDSWTNVNQIESPWRVIMLADDLNGLVNCDLVHNVCPPPSRELAQAKWIVPGKSTWSFLGGGGRSLENMKRYSQLAGKLGFEYNLVDAGWESWTNKWDGAKELVDYANQFNVKTLFWKHRRGLNDPAMRRDFFDRLSKAGAVGTKIDFIDSEDFSAVNFQTDTLKDAADYKLMVIFHGCNKPTGLERTWPNEVGREGIPGLEKRPPWAFQNTVLPFTRLVAGHADFTPMSFSENKIGDSTYAHQIATVISYTTSMQNVGAHPQSILDNPAVEVIKSIPVDWDETRVLPSSKIGSLLAFARKKGNDWFVCVLNGDEANAKTVQVPLTFLGRGTYNATLVKDNPDVAHAVVMDSTKVTAKDSVTVQMRASGGWAARLERAPTGQGARSVK